MYYEPQLKHVFTNIQEQRKCSTHPSAPHLWSSQSIGHSLIIDITCANYDKNTLSCSLLVSQWYFHICPTHYKFDLWLLNSTGFSHHAQHVCRVWLKNEYIGRVFPINNLDKELPVPWSDVSYWTWDQRHDGEQQFCFIIWPIPVHALERTQLVKITVREFLDDIYTEYKLSAYYC